MQGRFIATATAAALAALAIGPAAALATPGSFVDDAVGDFAAGTAQSASVANPGVLLTRSMLTQPFDGTTLPTNLVASSAGAASVSGGLLTVDGGNVTE